MNSLSIKAITSSVLLLAIGFGCVNVRTQVTTPGPGQPADSVNRVSIPDYRMPSDAFDISYQGLRVDLIRKFYSKRDERLFWTRDQAATTGADSLITFIRDSKYYGLSPDNYQLDEIQDLSSSLRTAENIFRFEALLTNAYIALVQHISFGRTASKSYRPDSISVAALENSSITGELINNILQWESRSPHYRSLKHGLKLILDSQAVQQNQKVLPDNKVLKRIQTIEVNLERLRLEKTQFTRRYILINIPAFMLYLVENDSIIMESKVVVGIPEKPTPELSSTIECFVTYPYWHVPRKIAVEEYLPIVRVDTSFLARNNFDVLDRNGNILDPDSIDWKKFNENYFPVRLRQREGPGNALGVIKFVFDNPYAVFLHDTNAKRLFGSRVRAFSHGCIRMEKAVELSHYLVTGDLKKKSGYVERLLKEQSRHTVDVLKPIPIHVRYYTADVVNGKVEFYADIYKKDGIILNEFINSALMNEQ